MKRLVAVLLIGVMAAALLAGCGPKGRQAGPEAESIEQGESAEQAVNEIIDDFADVLAGLDTPAGDLPDQGRDALRELLCDFFQEFHMPCGY